MKTTMARILIKVLGGWIMRKLVSYLTIFIIICFASNSALIYSIGKEIDQQPLYYLSFASIGANLLESRLDCWAKIKTVSTKQEVDLALTKILLKLNLPAEEKKFMHQENTDTMVTQYGLHANDQDYLFIIQTSKIEKESYFLLTVTSNKDDQQMRNDEKKLKEIMECKSYYRYKAGLDIQPSQQGQEELLKVMMKNLHSFTDTIYKDNLLVSATGFSDKITVEAVKVGGRNCNVQAAIRNNSKTGKGEVYLGFPLLLNDY